MLTDITNHFPEVSCGVGVDGIYFDSNYTPLAPTFFINGYEGSDRHERVHLRMENSLRKNESNRKLFITLNGFDNGHRIL